MNYKINNNIKSKIITTIMLVFWLFSYTQNTSADYTAIQNYFIQNQWKLFEYIKWENYKFYNWTEISNTVDNSWNEWTNTWNWEYLWLWNDEFYQNMKINEFDTKQLITESLNKLKSNIEVNDNNIQLLNQNINKIYWNDTYYIFWIKFKNTSYFVFWDNYIILKPYLISWNSDYFNSEIKGSITKIINENKNQDVSKQYEEIKKYLTKMNISYYVFNKVDSTNIKLAMWEARSAKIEFENQTFFIDKWYQPEAIQKVADTDVLIYTIVSKEDLVRNNILNSNNNISLIQPYIKFWWISISLNYLWDSTYSNLWNKWKTKIQNYNTKQEYIVEKNNNIYIIILFWSIISIILWIIWNWFYYQKKYKEIFMKISEGTK